jgi:hypothetical protein
MVYPDLAAAVDRLLNISRSPEAVSSQDHAPLAEPTMPKDRKRKHV